MYDQKTHEVQNVMIYGLCSEEKNELTRVLPPHFEIVDCTDSYTDLFAVQSLIVMVRGSRMPEEERNDLSGFYREVQEYCDETVIWIGDPKPEGYKNPPFKTYDSFYEALQKVRELALAAYQRKKRSGAFSAKLSDCLKILNLICERPGIRTSEIADEVGLSLRTTQRDIAALRTAIVVLNYDPKRKGWYVDRNPGCSLLDYL